MGTEEDTFRVLTKPPFAEIDKIYTEYWWEFFTAGDRMLQHDEADLFLRKHGWTLYEYNTFRRRTNGR